MSRRAFAPPLSHPSATFSRLPTHPGKERLMKTTILLEHEPLQPGGTAHGVRALLRIEAEPRPSGARAPLDLAIVLDRSGSMHGPKLAAARAAAAQLVRRCAPEDVLSVVAYDGVVTTVAPPATGAAQADLPRRIEAIQSG